MCVTQTAEMYGIIGEKIVSNDVAVSINQQLIVGCLSHVYRPSSAAYKTVLYTADKGLYIMLKLWID